MRSARQISLRCVQILLLTAVTITAACLAQTKDTQNLTASFTFGGLRLTSSVAEIKASFPNSYVNAEGRSTAIHVANADVQDGITAAVIFYRNNQAHYAQMTFEKHFDKPMPDAFMRDPLNVNPACEPTLKKLSSAYGKPYGPFDGEEEGLRYKEYVWDNATEKLIYTCARFEGKSKKKLWAALIKIAQNPPGTCMHTSCIEAPQ